MNKELAKNFFSCKNISIDLGGREILRNINIDIPDTTNTPRLLGIIPRTVSLKDFFGT